WIRTSLMPYCGTGTSSSQRPTSAFFLTSACMVFIAGLPGELARRAKRIEMTEGWGDEAASVPQAAGHRLEPIRFAADRRAAWPDRTRAVLSRCAALTQNADRSARGRNTD